MRMPHRLIDWLNDSSRDLAIRSFALNSITAAFTLTVIFLWDIFIGESAAKLAMLAVTILAMYIVIPLAVRIHQVQLGAVLMSLAIIFLVLPVEFFTGDGVYGCTPIWYSYAFLYIGLVVTGRKKYVILGLLPVSAVTCYLIAYLHPEFLTTHDMRTAYLDSIASLIGVGFLLFISISFLVRIYDRERILARKQREEIEELNRSQSRFFSSMSHEIRTPINTIIGLNEMILREEISDEVAEDATNIRSAGKLLLHLINDILDMSKFEAGQMKINPVPYDVGAMLSDIVGLLWLRAREKGLEFRVDVDPSTPSRLVGDEVRIRQILINVLTNAIKYTVEGSITLSLQAVREQGDQVRMIYTVSDTGMGIKKENIPYLFSAFKRVDEEKNRYIEGTGLGLAIVKQFADLMGGSVKVNSVYLQGSTFVIEIPQKAASDEALGEVKFESKHDFGNRTSYHKTFEAPDARILAVDDNEANLMVVRKLLRDTRIQIDTAKSGEEALTHTLTSRYDLIFMDHLMPEMDGVECLHAMRVQAGGMCRESRVVALTANAGSDNQEFYAREGFDGYLVKPVNGEELENEVMRLLPRELIHLSDEVVRPEAEEVGARASDHRKRIPVMITTDSVCDLPRYLIDDRRVRVMPYQVRTKDGVFQDGIELSQRGLLAYLRDPERRATSQCPQVRDYESFFGGVLLEANDIIHISMTDLVSEGFATAAEAARTFNNVTVVDSGHLSAGLGMIVLEAVRLAGEGQSPERIIAHINSMEKRVHTSFIIDDSMWLARAGRINPMVSRIAQAFLLRPILKLKKGRMTVSRICIGEQEHSYKRYIGYALAVPGEIDTRRIFIVHVGLQEKMQERIREEVLKKVPFETVIFQKASPAIAINCGPGSFGLLFMTK
ncbi:MAG: DegV family EDD domain-containing protein [Lachnospiraceae bacterium]|nr:DegV family EDD domain-containing protein [Lachnospiraceae bacterium]